MRLIDADSLLNEVGNYNLQVTVYKSDGRLEIMTKVSQAVQDHAAQCIADAHTIDPETLPAVSQLREELDRVTAERDAAMECIRNVRMDILTKCKADAIREIERFFRTHPKYNEEE